jgi:hypothetical protein
MKKLLVILILVSLTIGCATGEKTRMYVHENMSKQEVTDLLGNPDGFRRYEDSRNHYVLITYTDKVISGWNVRRTADYYFIFKNDRLSEWGTGEVRVSQSSTGMIMFVPITY